MSLLNKKLLYIGDKNTGDLIFRDVSFVRVERAFHSTSIRNRVLRRIRPVVGLSLGVWKNDVNEYECVVLSDQSYRRGMVPFLKRRGAKRIVLYLRNTMEFLCREKYRIDFEDILRAGCEIWSYQKQDCIRYGFKYNPQFYDMDLPLMYAKEELLYDVVFLGDCKDRQSMIDEVYRACVSSGLVSFFWVLNYRSSYNRNVNNTMLPYDSYIRDVLNRTRAVIDIVDPVGYGLTLRPLEAIAFKKKLITTYKELKDEQLYNKNNHFIYGEDDFSRLYTFVKAPYVEEADDKTEKIYSSEQWAYRILMNQELL